MNLANARVKISLRTSLLKRSKSKVLVRFINSFSYFFFMGVGFDEWQKLDLRIGKILKVEDIESTDKLYKLEVDIGESSPRILVAGIKQHYQKEGLIGKQVVVFTNLEPKTMKGITSHGMILAAVSEDHKKVLLLKPEKSIKLGSKIQ